MIPLAARLFFLFSAAYPYVLEATYFFWMCFSGLQSLGESAEGYAFLLAFSATYVFTTMSLAILLVLGIRLGIRAAFGTETVVCFLLMGLWLVTAFYLGSWLQWLPFTVCG